MKIKILFVVKMCDPVLYRVNFGWRVEEMDREIFEIDVVDCMQQDITSKIMWSDIIIYYRVIGFDASGLFTAREAGKIVGYMIDDYLLEFEYGYLIAEFMRLSHFNIVTTHILRDLYQAAGINTPFYVKIHGLPVTRLLTLKSPVQKKDPDRLRIGWLGGFTHHIFTPEVEEMLSALSRCAVPCTLICFGKPDDFVGRASALPHITVENLPFIPFEDETGYYSAIANTGLDMVVNFIPLNSLGMGKSQLKYMETGLYHIPLITSSFGIWPTVIHQGINGLLAGSPADFAEKVLYLRKNPVFRTAIAENAYQDIINNYHIKSRAKEMGGFFSRLYHELKG